MAINLENTAQIVSDMAEDMRYRAQELDRIAQELKSSNDPKVAVEALMTATNLVNLKLDKLVLLPMNQMLRHIAALEENAAAGAKGAGDAN